MALSDYTPLINSAAQRYNLDPSLLTSLINVESHGDPRAVSPAGAQGLAQLMPATGRSLGVTNPFDPAQSINGGAQYLRQGLDATGNQRDALRYYNGGPAFASKPSTDAYASQVLGGIQPQPGAPPVAPSLGSLSNDPSVAQTPPLQPQGASLGALASSLPQGIIPAKKPNRLNFGNIAGILGDALMAYDKMPPQFAPFMREQQILGQQQNFEMQKYRQQIAMQMYLMSNGLDTETGKQLIAAGVQPGTPEWQAGMARSASNSLDPVVNTAQGPVLRSSVVPHFDPQAVAMLREAMAKGDHAAAQEFDEHFGRGSALQALGQQ
jgi:hypothetical protein